MAVSTTKILITPAARAALQAERGRLQEQLLTASTRPLSEPSRRGDAEDPEDRMPIVTPLGAVYELLDNGTLVDLEDARGLAAAVGTRITIRAEDGEEESYTLTSPPWVDAPRGRISWDSPIGRAVMGKRVGDSVLVQAPGGSWVATIIGVVEA